MVGITAGIEGMVCGMCEVHINEAVRNAFRVKKVTSVLQGILIPFLGTTFGSACMLFMKKKLNPMLQRVLTGFAAGFTVMMALDVALG